MVTEADQTSICPICIYRRSDHQDSTHKTQLREVDSGIFPYNPVPLSEDDEVEDKEEEEEKRRGRKKQLCVSRSSSLTSAKLHSVCACEDSSEMSRCALDSVSTFAVAAGKTLRC